MKLVIKYNSVITSFVKDEVKVFSTLFNELTPGIAVIDADFKSVIINSSLLEYVGVLFGFHNSVTEFEGFNFKDFINSNESFKIKCSDRKVCIELGQLIKDSTGASVSLESPDKTVTVEQVGNKLLAYLIISGENKLTQRGYAVSNNEFITSDIARVMVDFSGWNDNGLLIDIFCHEGYIIIEAVLKTLNVGPGYFKSKELSFKFEEPKIKKISSEILCFSNDMNEIKLAKQAVKLAKIFKYVNFGFHDLEDLDYKMKEETIDYLITALPRKVNVEKLFFQLDYVMKKEGVIVLLTNHDISSCSKYDFKIVDKIIIGDKKLYKLVRA
ncbi:MAG: hypothetical protein JW791_05505 [Nanoarchaeota archaeon]|nr:hypothetical protein [Nanoarchaeota archaeon]